MNKPSIDYLSFSIRLDEKNPVTFKGVLNLSYVFSFLGMDESEFSSCGRVKYYKEMYVCNDIAVKIPFDGQEGRQGFLITMSGNGCRYYEQLQKDSELSVDFLDIWRNFLCKVRHLNSIGLAVNISRLDIAVDDFEGLLEMDKICSCVRRDEVVTRFQSKEIPEGQTDIYHVQESVIRERFFRRIRGTSVTFGSRSSRAFCRFYDKRAEQLQRHFTDKERVKEVEEVPHWVRMEFEFKDEVAIKMVNALCDEENFPLFYAEYVNGMIRFVERDDSNATRCSTKNWWREFIGTSEKVRLAVGDYRPTSRKRHLEYVYKKLSGAIYTAMNIEGVDDFLKNVLQVVDSKLNPKHRKLCAGFEHNLKELCSAELWDALKVTYREKEPVRDEYHYTEKKQTEHVSFTKFGQVAFG